MSYPAAEFFSFVCLNRGAHVDAEMFTAQLTRQLQCTSHVGGTPCARENQIVPRAPRGASVPEPRLTACNQACTRLLLPASTDSGSSSATPLLATGTCLSACGGVASCQGLHRSCRSASPSPSGAEMLGSVTSWTVARTRLFSRAQLHPSETPAHLEQRCRLSPRAGNVLI